MSSGAAEAAGTMLWTRITDPAQRAELLNNQPGVTLDAAKTWMVGTLQGEEDSAGVQHTAAIYSQLNDHAKDRYFTGPEQDFLDAYLANVASGQDTVSAYKNARIARNMTAVPEGSKEGLMGAVRGLLEDRYDSMWQFLPWRPDRVTGPDLDLLASAVYTSAKNAGGPASLEVKARRALSRMLDSRAVELVGGTTIWGGTGKRPLNQVFTHGTDNLSMEEAADAMDMYLTTRAKELGVENVQARIVYRQEDYDTPDGKGAQFLVEWQYEDKDGLLRVRTDTFTSDAVKKLYRNKQREEAAAAQARQDARMPVDSRGTNYRRQWLLGQ